MRFRNIFISVLGLLSVSAFAVSKLPLPAENPAGLAKAGVPMFIIHGDSDRVVPYNDNSALIKEKYDALRGTIEVKIVPGKGHAEVPEFFRDQALLEFIFKQAKEK